MFEPVQRKGVLVLQKKKPPVLKGFSDPYSKLGPTVHDSEIWRSPVDIHKYPIYVHRFLYIPSGWP